MTPKRVDILLWSAMAIVAVGAALASVWLAVYTLGSPERELDIHGTYLHGGRPIADFKLIDHTGKDFTPQQLQGTWTLLTFGYRHCPDTTPETLEMLSFTYRLLENAELANNVQVVFLSVDTKRDTVDRLAEFIPRFHSEFIAVTGAKQEIIDLTKSVGIRLEQTKVTEPGYSIQPQGTVLLISPAGELIALFTPPHHPQLIAEDVYNIIKRHGRLNWLAPITN